MRTAARVDANQRQVTQILRVLGFSVAITSGCGDGFPDLAVGRWGITLLVELKNGEKPPSDRKLTDLEIKFHGGWRGAALVATSTEEIVCEMERLRGLSLRR